MGFAAGYIYGGLVASALGWRAAFIIESVAILPFVVFAFSSKPLHLAGSRDRGSGKYKHEQKDTHCMLAVDFLDQEQHKRSCTKLGLCASFRHAC